jgi:hypothetical protein
MPKGTRTDSEDALSEIQDVDEIDDGQEIEDDDADLDDDPDDAPEGDEEGDDEDDDEDDEPLREEGKKALDRMKALVKDLKKSLREAKAELEQARNGSDEEDDELTVAQRERDNERTKRQEAEKKLAAKMHGLPESWADRLQGDDLDDYLDDAESLAADMPAPDRRKGGGGAKDGHRKPKQPSLDDQIAEAEKDGDFATARRLKAQKVHQLRQAAG